MLNQTRQLPNRGLLEQRNHDAGNSSALTHSHGQQSVIWAAPPTQRVSLYDSQGRQIVGEENIKREVARREAE